MIVVRKIDSAVVPAGRGARSHRSERRRIRADAWPPAANVGPFAMRRFPSSSTPPPHREWTHLRSHNISWCRSLMGRRTETQRLRPPSTVSLTRWCSDNKSGHPPNSNSGDIRNWSHGTMVGEARSGRDPSALAIQRNRGVDTMIPEWLSNGNLLPGVHFATWTEIEERLAFNPRRRRLLAGFREACEMWTTRSSTRCFGISFKSTS